MKTRKNNYVIYCIGVNFIGNFGVTFSYLAPSINNVESNSTVVFNAGTIAINYENGQNQINASEVLPGWTSIKEFSLTAINNTTISTAGAMNYAIKLIVEKIHLMTELLHIQLKVKILIIMGQLHMYYLIL